MNEDLENGVDIPHSSGYLINGELGDFANCSSGTYTLIILFFEFLGTHSLAWLNAYIFLGIHAETTYRWSVDYGKTYLLRIVNAVSDDQLFFAIAEHNLTVVGLDAAYIKPVETSYIMISPGQTMDVLLTANRPLGHYYMASREFLTENATQDHNNGSAIIEYAGDYNFSSSPIFPHELPQVLDMKAALRFTGFIKSLANEDYPVDVPMDITTRMFIVISMKELCKNRTDCDVNAGASNILASSMNNISWVNPTVDVLEAYYRQLSVSLRWFLSNVV